MDAPPVENTTFNFNSTMPHVLHTATKGVAVTIALSACLLGLYGNTLILLGAFQCKKLRGNIDTLIINLSGADLIVCIVVSPLFIVLIMCSSVDLPVALCLSHQFIGIVGVTVSFLSLDIIALYRQFRIMQHFKCNVITKTALGIIIGLWVFGLLYSSVSILYWKFGQKGESKLCMIVPNKEGENTQYILLFIGPIWLLSQIVYLVCYSFICHAVLEQNRRRKRSASMMCRQAHDNISLPPEKSSRALLMCFLVILEFSMTIGPVCIVELLEIHYGFSYKLLQVKVAFTPLIFVHSACNPFLYAQQNNTLRNTQAEVYQRILQHDWGCHFTRRTRLTVAGHGNLKENLQKSSHDSSADTPQKTDKAVGPSEPMDDQLRTPRGTGSGVYCITGSKGSSLLSPCTSTRGSLGTSLHLSQLLPHGKNSTSRVSHYQLEDSTSSTGSW